MSAPLVSNIPEHTVSFDGPVYAVAYRAGVVYVGGAFSSATLDGVSKPRHNLAAVNASTGALMPWRPKADRPVYALRTTKTWTYVGGAFRHLGKGKHLNVGRVRTGSGKVDTAFRPGTNRAVRGLALYGRTLYVGGSFSRANGKIRTHLAAFNTRKGALVKKWRPRTSGTVYSVEVARKTVFVGGRFAQADGLNRGGHLAPLTLTTGAVKKGYVSSIQYRVWDIAVSGKTIYAAIDGPGGGLRAVRLNGRSKWNAQADGSVQAVTVVGGNVYVGGHFDHICTDGHVGSGGLCSGTFVARWKFAAYTPGGSLLGWSPQANGKQGTFALAGNARAGILASGGAWTKFASGTIDQSGFALFR